MLGRGFAGRASSRARVVVVSLVAALACLTTPSPVDAQGSLSHHVYTGGAGTRNYDLFVPNRAGPIPLVVYLHGCGAPPFVPGLNESAEARGFAVAYPVQALSANANGCWNWYVSEHQHRDAGEPSLIAGITRQVMQQRNIDPQRVFISGHSAGSGMAANMSAAYPDVYAAAAIIAGCGQQTCQDVTGLTAYREMGPRARAVPAYVLWGTEDPTNPYVTGRVQLMQWLGMNDLADDDLLNLSVPRLPTSVQYRPAHGTTPAYTVEQYRDLRDCAEVRFTSVLGMGHVPDATWPPAFPAMVDFLLTHPMRSGC